MKSLIIISIFFFIVLSPFAQSRIYPLLPGDVIEDIYFINENEGIFVNSGGGIFKTYDGGLTWEQKEIFQGEKLQKIRFLDDLNGFISPNASVFSDITGLIVTSNGGEEWRVENLSVRRAIDFLPVAEGVLLQSNSEGLILRLDNFFNQWDTTYSLPQYVYHDEMYGDYYYSYGTVDQFELLPSGDILALAVYWDAAAKEIIVDSLNVLLRSKDQGVTWEKIWSGLSNFVTKIDFISDTDGFLLADTIYYTSNGGEDWVKKGTTAGLSNTRFIQDFSAVTSEAIFAIGDTRVFFSTDQGISWSDLGLELRMYDNIYTVDDNATFIYGTNFLRSSNSGNIWQNINDHILDHIYELDFVNTNVGLASGSLGFYKTTNGGRDWLSLDFPLPNSIAMVSETYGFICRYDLGLLKTTNAGLTWDEIELENNPDSGIRDVYFFNDSLGYINGAQKLISSFPNVYEVYNYITTNGGNTWQIIYSDSSLPALSFDKVIFLEPNFLFGMNDIIGLWKSVDSAKTWELICDPELITGNSSFDFFNDKFGVIANSYWENLVTTDGGKSWKSFSKDIGIHPADIEILGKDIWDRYIVYECGQQGKLAKYSLSESGEVLFQRQIITGTNERLTQIEKYYNGDNLHTWVAGYGFNLYYRDHQLEITSIEENEDKTLSDFTLSQNYPNPFNPSTKIKFSILHSQFATLKVYDVLGREVQTLLNKPMQPGSYEIEFDGSGLTSGVYFYVLESGEARLTKKMLLLK